MHLLRVVSRGGGGGGGLSRVTPSEGVTSKCTNVKKNRCGR